MVDKYEDRLMVREVLEEEISDILSIVISQQVPINPYVPPPEERKFKRFGRIYKR